MQALDFHAVLRYHLQAVAGGKLQTQSNGCLDTVTLCACVELSTDMVDKC